MRKPIYEVSVSQDPDTNRFVIYNGELHAFTESSLWKDVSKRARELIAVVADLDPEDFYIRIKADKGMKVA